MVLFITNKGNAAISNLQVEIGGTASLAVSVIDGDPAPQVRQSQQSTVFSVPLLQPGLTATQLVSLQYRDISLVSSGTQMLGGQILRSLFTVLLAILFDVFTLFYF